MLWPGAAHRTDDTEHHDRNRCRAPGDATDRAGPRAPAPRRAVTRAILALTGLALLMLVLVGVLEAVGPGWLVEPSSWQSRASLFIALASALLLVGDVVLPVPSTVVLVTNGVLFGPVVGTVVSAVGLLGGAMVGHELGRRGTPLARRMLGEPGAAWLTGAVERRGPVLVAAARPVPLLAELSVIVAGATGMHRPAFVVSATVGSIATAAAFALMGAGVGAVPDGLVILGVVLVAGTIAWCWTERRRRENRRP